MENTKLYQELQKRESKYLDGVAKVYEYALDILPKINRVFGNYTGHGVEHSIHVMEYMYDLVTDISQMSDLEIACLIEAALLHDIGMAVNENEITAIKEDRLVYQKRKYSVIYEKYQNENLALQECIRPAHGERSFNHIMKMNKELFIIPEYTNCNFQVELAKICQAHTMDQEWLLHNLDYSQEKGKDELNAQYVAMLLRVADYLDMDEKRASIELYRFLEPERFGDEEWRQHYIIENTNKVVKNKTFGDSSIVLYGKCDNAKIHRKFLRYLSGISEELLWCTSYTRKHFNEKYWILLQPQIDNRIVTYGFEISDLQLHIDYHAVTTLLMGENVYGDRRCGLRELVQNAVDACQVMVEEAEHMEKYQYDPYVPLIQVIVDYKTEKIIIMDNGIGMDNYVLTNYFLTIGKSYYRSNEFLYQGKSYHSTGTFGIGFLACFMLSDSVMVETKHYTDQEGFTIELEKDSEYICKRNHVSLVRDSGTAIILNLESVLEAFGEEENIKEYLKRTFLDQGVKIRFVTIHDTRSEEILQLQTFEELNPQGVRLDSYLNGISVSWEFNFDDLKASNKFSDLCFDRLARAEERIYAEFDSDAGQLCVKDTIGKDLKKYIVNDHIMILKIRGIKDEKVLHVRGKDWTKLLGLLLFETSKYILIPIRYDEALFAYCDKRGVIHDFVGVVWYNANVEILKIVLGNIDYFLSQYKLLIEEDGIELGVLPVISVNSEYYISYNDNYEIIKEDYELLENYNSSYKTYCHGIRLERGSITPSLKIHGVYQSGCITNIINKNIIPNVSRDKLTSGVKDMITLAIERAALQYIISKFSEDKELQEALQTYVEKNYPKDNPYYVE